MDSSHGCLYGKSYDKNSSEKIYPEVELVNYDGKAKIICSLVEEDNFEEHPHSFHVNEPNQELFVEVPEEDSYIVSFPGLCIVQTEVKKVPEWLFKRHDIGGLTQRDIANLQRECSFAAKKINLNVVRLKFSAYSSVTNEEICAPVISDPINNLKNAATNILKICKISKLHGRAQGGDDVIVLVERVVKKNIKIRFYELSEDGSEVWHAFAHFLDSDVHHQYAISFRTPPYRNINTTKRVLVYIELLRPTDGRTSKPMEFYYTPDLFSKKRKFNCNFETPPRTPNQSNNTWRQLSIDDISVSQPTISCVGEENSNVHSVTPQAPLLKDTDPMLPQNMIYQTQNQPDYNCREVYGLGVNNQPCHLTILNIDPQNMHLVPTESIPHVATHQELIDNIATSTSTSTSMDASAVMESTNNSGTGCQMSFAGLSLTDLYGEEYCDFFDDLLSSDSGGQVCLSSKRGVSGTSDAQETDRATVKQILPNIPNILNEEDVSKPSAVMAKSLNNIIKLIQTKNTNSTVMIKSLEDLFRLRLSNGDTFIHMALPTRQPLFSYIVNAVHRFDMAHLLNIRNHNLQTILHLAIINDMPDIINFLVSKGCDPMLEDLEGNNVFHYSLICVTGLGPLLEAVKMYNMPYDLNAFNYDKQTPLHLAVIYKDPASAKMLLKEGASCRAADIEGRFPLHLAVYDDCLSVASELLTHMKLEDINEEDGRGYNALQITCSGELRENTEEMMKLLLEHKADPMKGGKFQSAWHLVKNKPELRNIMTRYMGELYGEEDYTSDEYQSANDESD